MLKTPLPPFVAVSATRGRLRPFFHDMNDTISHLEAEILAGSLTEGLAQL
jgi:hypothetical protein